MQVQTVTCLFVHGSRENSGDMKAAVCELEAIAVLWATEKAGHKHPANPKICRKNPLM